MKWVRFSKEGQVRYGLLEGGSLIATESGWEDVLAGRVRNRGTNPVQGDLQYLAPVPLPQKIVAVGMNYMDHCREQKFEPPRHPILFAKFPNSLTGHGSAITWSNSLTSQVDLEVELAVIIGRTTRGVKESEALDSVLGYSAANDVSARDLQFGDGQWTRGKSLDGFCPLGPCLVTADEIEDPQRLKLSSDLNGRKMQESSTAEMIFPVARLISYCSQSFTLAPGDILLTGTPAGVGVFRHPPVFMQDGDRVGVEIEAIGRLENTCHVTDS